MKKLFFAGRAVQVGDSAADAVVEYTAVLARSSRADTVELRALNKQGHKVEVYYVLDAAAAVMSQTVDSTEPEPENDEAVRYMRAAIHRLDPDPADYRFTSID